MTRVTGSEFLRGRLADRFSPFSRLAHRAFLDRNGRPSRMLRVSTRGSSFVRVTRDASGLEDELLLVPVVVMDVGTVETLDHFGGAGAGFDGLEDAEGDESAAQSVIQSSQVPAVTALRYSLPTRMMRARICICAAPRAPCRVAFAPPASCCISIASPTPACVTCAALMSSLSVSSSFWVAEQDTAGVLKGARAYASTTGQTLLSPVMAKYPQIVREQHSPPIWNTQQLR